MRSRSGARGWLLNKEWRELLASRAWWVMLALIGPLVGLSFISAVGTYAEASGLGGTSAGVGEAFSPLDGVLAPTMAAYEIAATFLLPFIAIRLVGGDRQSGALKLELQQPVSAFTMMGAKGLVLLAGWGVASLGAVLAVALWKSYGGAVYGPEFFSLVLGHTLNAGLTIALAAAAAAVAENPSTAAILTLAFTVGTWVLGFIAAVEGGVWELLAGYTPEAMLQVFQRGLVRLDLVLAALTLIATGLVLAGIWMRLGIAVPRRALESAGVLIAAGLVVVVCSYVRMDWDVSESRRNAFSEADEAQLRQIRTPLVIEAHLAPEDPRRFDLERHALAKLRRVMPHLTVRYIASTSIGIFEQANSHYGEIWYDLGGRREMSRVTSAEGVLETIYALAHVTPPVDEGAAFRGHPLAARPIGAAALFYGLWPVAVVIAAVIVMRRHV